MINMKYICKENLKKEDWQMNNIKIISSLKIHYKFNDLKKIYIINLNNQKEIAAAQRKGLDIETEKKCKKKILI